MVVFIHLFEAAIHLQRQDVCVERNQTQLVLSKLNLVKYGATNHQLLQQVQTHGELLGHEIHMECARDT